MSVSSTADAGSGLQSQVFTGPYVPFEAMRGTFSPTTATLIFGSQEAVLIDAEHIRSDVAALGDLIEQAGRRLTTIYVTHGHADHWYGAGALARRFPTADVVATRPVVDYIGQTSHLAAKQWSSMFGERVVSPTVMPRALDATPLDLEGNEIRIVEVGQGDIAPSTVVHIPAIDMVVAGDVVYNEVHVMLAFAGRDHWRSWMDSLDVIEALHPKMIVAGHKRPGVSDRDVARMLDQTRSYIRDFADLADTMDNSRELVKRMKEYYPGFGNEWTLRYSARAWFTRRDL